MSRILNFQINEEIVGIMNFTERLIYFGYHVASFQEFIFGSTECSVRCRQSFLYLTTLPVVFTPPWRAHYAMIPCDPVYRLHHSVSLGCSAATVNTPAPCCTPGTPCLHYHSVRWSGPGTKKTPDISNSVLIQRTEWSFRSRWTGFEWEAGFC